MFELLARDEQTKARRGGDDRTRGGADTYFHARGTQGSVKTLHPEDLDRLGLKLFWKYPPSEFASRNGDNEEAGGLHQFSAWDKPILTDSGGFQVWSLSKLNKITEEVEFASHLDGTRMMLSREISMEIQATWVLTLPCCLMNVPLSLRQRLCCQFAGLTTRWGKGKAVGRKASTSQRRWTADALCYRAEAATQICGSNRRGNLLSWTLTGMPWGYLWGNQRSKCSERLTMPARFYLRKSRGMRWA